MTLSERIVFYNSIFEVDVHLCYVGFPELELFMERLEKAFVLVYCVITFFKQNYIVM